MKKGLFALALGTFTLGMAEFIIEGIITDVAHDMNVSIPQVGHLISIYALGVCAGSFSLILMHKYRPKHILLFLASLITLGAAIAAIGTGTIVAVKIAKEGKGTSAVAMMCAGMPFANLMGVPLGTFLSHNLSWRAPFLMSILLGLITLYMIYRWVPNVEALPNNGMKAQFRFLRNLVPWLIIAATFLGSAGMLSWFSYISPLLQMEGGFMVVGNLTSGPLSDRFKPGRITSCYLVLAATSLLLTFFFSAYAWAVAVLMFFTCVCLFGVGSPEQYLIVKHSEGGEMLGGCCIQAAFNSGNALGALLGGIPISLGMGYNYPALIGVPLTLGGAICLYIFHKRFEGPSTLGK